MSGAVTEAGVMTTLLRQRFAARCYRSRSM
jgi:hypothetical protein